MTKTDTDCVIQMMLQLLDSTGGGVAVFDDADATGEAHSEHLVLPLFLPLFPLSRDNWWVNDGRRRGSDRLNPYRRRGRVSPTYREDRIGNGGDESPSHLVRRTTGDVIY